MFHNCGLCQSASPTVSASAGHIQQHIARAENKLGQFAVDAVDQASQRSRQRAIQAAKERFHRRSEGLKDANGIRIGLDAVAKRLQIANQRPARSRKKPRRPPARASTAEHDSRAQEAPHPASSY